MKNSDYSQPSRNTWPIARRVEIHHACLGFRIRQLPTEDWWAILDVPRAADLEIIRRSFESGCKQVELDPSMSAGRRRTELNRLQGALLSARLDEAFRVDVVPIEIVPRPEPTARRSVFPWIALALTVSVAGGFAYWKIWPGNIVKLEKVAVVDIGARQILAEEKKTGEFQTDGNKNSIPKIENPANDTSEEPKPVIPETSNPKTKGSTATESKFQLRRWTLPKTNETFEATFLRLKGLQVSLWVDGSSTVRTISFDALSIPDREYLVSSARELFDATYPGQSSRTWVSANGLHTQSATLIAKSDDILFIQKASGCVISARLNSLSKADQEFVHSQRTERTQH